MYTFPKPLSTKEERIYLQKMKNGDTNARNILIERNMRLVAHIVKKYSLSDVDNEDMISIGTIGLIKAIDTFEVEKNYKLATYAARCIDNELLMMIRSDKKNSKEVYMNEVINMDNAGNTISLIDIIESEDVDVAEKMYVSDSIKKMYKYMWEILSEREIEILCLRYGLMGREELTQREISKRMGISRSYVSRIEKKAINKIRQCFKMN